MTDREQGYYEGFAEAILYAQAYADRRGGRQTHTTHLPAPDYTDNFGFRFDKDILADVIRELDEGGTTVFRFDKDEFGSDTIEVGGSEGFFGLPDWVTS